MLYDDRLSGKKSKLGKSSIMDRDSIFSIIFANFSVYDPHFWELISTSLYLFHQTEEHYVPNGFKKVINRIVMALPEGQKN